MSDPERVRKAVYSVLVHTGRGPSIDELADLVDEPADQVKADLRELAAAHALVLIEAGDAVRMAHPFSSAPMGFVVAPLEGRDDRLWWGGCAWDSFGIGAALSLDVLITTTCLHCGQRHDVAAGPTMAPEALSVVRFPWPAAQWWDDVVHTCTNIRLFCTTGHAEDWARDSGSDVGKVVPLLTVWRLAQTWYGDRLSDAFVPRPVPQSQQLLTDVGLTGDFWALP